MPITTIVNRCQYLKLSLLRGVSVKDTLSNHFEKESNLVLILFVSVHRDEGGKKAIEGAVAKSQSDAWISRKLRE